MSNCPGTRIRYGAERKCDLHPSSKYPDAAKRDPEKIDRCRPYKDPPPPPPKDCDWRRYLLYAIPLMLYIPWAIGKMRCKPKCCPPASCCPQVKCQPVQNTCCPPEPVKCDENYQLKQQKDFRCGADKKACGEGEE